MKWKAICEAHPVTFLPQDLLHNPLFESLREHLPDKELWQGFETWNSSLSNYIYKCFQLIKKLENLVTQFSDCERTNDFTRPIFSQLDYFQQFGLWPDEPVFHTGKSALYVTIEFEGRVYHVLEANHPQNHIMSYQSLIDSFLSSNDVANIIQTYLELIEVSTSVKDILKQALINRTYVSYRCKLCS